MDNKIETKEGKRKFALWIRESTLEKVRQWYDEDNCASQSEFIEKAVQFYIGFISSDNGSDYLPKIIVSTLKGIVERQQDQQNPVQDGCRTGNYHECCCCHLQYQP